MIENSSRKRSRITIIFLLLTGMWIAGFAIFAGTSIFRTPQHLEQKTDAIVVLTGGDKRIEEGLMLFAAGKAKALFISGVHQDVTEKDIRKMWKGGGAIPECCITLGRSAISTLENAEETRDWLKDKNFHSIRLVTSNYHMNRSLLHFSLILSNVEIIPYPVQQPNMTPDTKRFWVILLSEYHKTLFRLAGGPVIYIEEWLKEKP